MTSPHELSLEAGIREWTARIQELSPGIPDLTSTDLVRRRAAARELSDRLAVDFTLPIPDGVEIDDVEIEGPDGTLRMRRYRPSGVPPLAPTQLWLHGGGFYAGTIDEILNDRLCARRASESGVQIFSLEYRLAPEHPYPAPVQDAAAALAALAADSAHPQGGRFGVDRERLGIGGNSAGAAIAASTALTLRDAGGTCLIHVDLEVPPAAMRPVGQSAIDYAAGFGVDEWERIVAMYAGPQGPADPRISLLDVEDLGGLPPMLIMVGEHDPLRDSGVQFCDRLREAGVPVELYVGAGQLHGSPGLTARVPGAREWQQFHSRHLALAYDTAFAGLAA